MVQSSSTHESKHIQDQSRSLRPRRSSHHHANINKQSSAPSPSSSSSSSGRGGRRQLSRSAKTVASAAVVAAINGTTPPTISPTPIMSTVTKREQQDNGKIPNNDKQPLSSSSTTTRKRRRGVTSPSPSPSKESNALQRKKRNNSNASSTVRSSHRHASNGRRSKTKAKHTTITQQTKPYRAGDQVEALKWVNDDTREWYCARIVTNGNERSTATTKRNINNTDIDDDNNTLNGKKNGNIKHEEDNEKIENDEELVFFVHYEGWTADHADWIGISSIRRIVEYEEEEGEEESEEEEQRKGSSSSSSLATSPSRRRQLQYGPLGKESETSWADYRTFYYSQEGLSLVKHHTGLVQDQRMLWHDCPCHSQEHIHPERPDRINAIIKVLYNDRLLRYFGRLRSREATIKELLRVHGLLHVGSYCPMESVENEADNLITESNPRATDITTNSSSVLSIRELLNQSPSETPSPASSPPPPTITTPPNDLSLTAATATTPTPTTKTTKATISLGKAQGMEGGKVVKADRNQIRKQRRRFSSAAASQAALNGTATLVNPPQLVYEMICGELAIEVDTPFHPLYTSISARLAAGSLMELTDQVIEGSLHNGFALIRPPGHHAENDRAMGFCFFNNVAVAVASTLEKYPDTIKKVLIIDWDIHHGNGTEKIFYKNPNVLYISLHRWEHGHFYPRTGAPDQCGEDIGEGFNVNIAFNNSKEKPRPMGDTEFLAAFYHIVLPIARQFAPDMIFVSAGFDAAEGHPDNIGGYQVTPRGFALLTKLTKDLAEEMCQGRLILSLEGGYELEPLANSAAACVAQLLPAKLVPDSQLKFEGCLRSIKPNLGAIQSLYTVVEIQRKYWHFSDESLDPSFRFLLPQEWRAKDSISIRPKRTVKPMKITAVQGY